LESVVCLQDDFVSFEMATNNPYQNNVIIRKYENVSDILPLADTNWHLRFFAFIGEPTNPQIQFPVASSASFGSPQASSSAELSDSGTNDTDGSGATTRTYVVSLLMRQSDHGHIALPWSDGT